MIHLKKGLCGYSQYTCIGIEQSPVLQAPVCDNKNYDILSDSRSVDNNFLNLPVAFQSVVQSVPFVELGKTAVWDATKCVTDYTPLQGNAIDAFYYLQSNSAYVAGYGDFKNSLYCYDQDKIEHPGILLPLAQLSAFGVVPLQAVPTAALPVSTWQQSVYYSRAIKSGCSGFRAEAKSIASYKVSFSITGGEVYVATDDSGAPVAIEVKDLLNQECQGKQNVSNIQIYVIAGFDVIKGEWKAVIDWKADEYEFFPSTPKKWIKQKQIATIKYAGRQTVDVIQSECSPIDLRDWMSQQAIPFRDGNYVFVYKGDSATKEWVRVMDC